MMKKCECDNRGILNSRFESWYDKEKELPFVNHEPNGCKCKNDIKRYKRKDKIIYLCSICILMGDEELKEKDIGGEINIGADLINI